MKMSMRQWIEDITASPERKAFPFMAGTGASLAGVRFADALRDAGKQAACVGALAKRYESAACITFMDLSVEAEAFGAEARWMGDETPTITGRIVTDTVSAGALEVPRIGAGRTGVYLEAARLAAECADRPLFGCLIGPFSLAGRLCGMTEALLGVHAEQAMLHTVLRKCAGFLEEYARAFKATGVNGVVIAEPAAGLMSPAQCGEFSSRYVKEIIGAVQDDDFMVILHNCGATPRHVDAMASTGAMGLHFGNVADMGEVCAKVPPAVLACGNLDPARVLKAGSVDEVRVKTLELLHRTAGFKNFLLSSGCDIPVAAPIENIDAMFRVLKAYNGKAVSPVS
ncbi:MAG: methylcobamide--CoM methyltransferase [Spirochaetes bacterium]|nr:MAG: methylcobamide--CoM methyltransferase [Spirochaetota bacterium]